MKEYSSLERVILALNHKEPDKIPFDLGASAVTGININALKNLKKYLGICTPSIIQDEINQIAYCDTSIKNLFKTDVDNVSPGDPLHTGLIKKSHREGNFYRLTDEFGIGWQMPLENGLYYDLYYHPLANAETIQDVENYPWPDPTDENRYITMKEDVKEVIEVKKKACFLERMSSGMWENAIWMTGYEKFFTDMYLNKKFIHALMEKILELKIKYWGKALDEAGDYPIIVSCADDLGTQNSLLVSLELYKEMIWPYHKRLFSFIKKKKSGDKAYIFFHNDGAIMDTIPLLIEAGIDILNPFQVNCKGMSTKIFKKEFGKDLTIWGGSCDTQYVLPRGTPQEVRDETKRRIDDLAPGGGFIFAPIHNIQGDVPPENIVAWWETLQEYGFY